MEECGLQLAKAWQYVTKIKINKKYGKEEGLQSSNIRSLAIENDVVWLYTQYGFVRYDGIHLHCIIKTMA